MHFIELYYRKLFSFYISIAIGYTVYSSACLAYVSPYFYALQAILHCVTTWFGTLIKRMNTDLS